MASSSLASLKACVPEFKPAELSDSGHNQDRRWKEWLENFELVLEFEGVTDPTSGPSRKRAALLTVGGPALRELFSTLTVADDKYESAKSALNTHFSPKKNLTAERYKFFCTKPTSTDEAHDHWITRLRSKGKDCEFENMNLDEAIKLVVTLHTPSEKLQREIIARDMDLASLIECARAIELTQREVTFIKQNTMEPSIHKIDTQQTGTAPVQLSATKYDTQRSKSTVQVCRYCGRQTPHRGKCKAKGATCNRCQKKGHFAVVCQSKPYKQVKRVEESEEEEEPEQERYAFNTVTCIYKLDKWRKGGDHKESKSEYETNVKLKINNNKLRVQIDSGADVNIMDYATYMNLNQPPPLKHSNAKLKPYNSKPIPVRGYFKASISANGKQVASKFYVTHSSNSVPILGKYTAFDLGILKISVKELTEAIDMASSAPFCSSINSESTVHM